MKLDVSVDSRSGDSRFASYVGETTRTELEGFSSKIQSVDIALSDLNGPKGGPDKECKIVLNRPRHKPVVLAVTALSSQGAFKMALKKLIKTLRRQLDKTMNRRHRSVYSSNLARQIAD